MTVKEFVEGFPMQVIDMKKKCEHFDVVWILYEHFQYFFHFYKSFSEKLLNLLKAFSMIWSEKFRKKIILNTKATQVKLQQFKKLITENFW